MWCLVRLPFFVMGYELRVMSYELRVMSYELRITRIAAHEPVFPFSVPERWHSAQR
jgi:hypothetical protein